MSEPQAARVMQDCDECGQADDHPRHVHQDVKDGQLAVQVRHLDCCAAAGCPDGTCGEILARAGNQRGASLVSALTGGI
jgi:hypothetical protein